MRESNISKPNSNKNAWDSVKLKNENQKNEIWVVKVKSQDWNWKRTQ